MSFGVESAFGFVPLRQNIPDALDFRPDVDASPGYQACGGVQSTVFLKVIRWVPGRVIGWCAHVRCLLNAGIDYGRNIAIGPYSG
jgi:hypothetical protein